MVACLRRDPGRSPSSGRAWIGSGRLLARARLGWRRFGPVVQNRRVHAELSPPLAGAAGVTDGDANAGGFAAAASAGNVRLRRAGERGGGGGGGGGGLRHPALPERGRRRESVSAVNGGIAISNRERHAGHGVAATQQSLGTSTTAARESMLGPNDGQANVLYDYTGRWFMAAESRCRNKDRNAWPGFVCMAVSQRTMRPAPSPSTTSRSPPSSTKTSSSLWGPAAAARRAPNNFGATSLIGRRRVCGSNRTEKSAEEKSGAQCFLVPGPATWTLAGDPRGVSYQPPGVRAARPGLFLNVDTGAGKLNLWKLQADFTTPANSTLGGNGRRRVLAHLRDHGGVRSAAEPGQRAHPGVRARLMRPVGYPQLRDTRALNRQPQRRRRGGRRRALVRAAGLALGLPAREEGADGSHGPWEALPRTQVGTSRSGGGGGTRRWRGQGSSQTESGRDDGPGQSSVNSHGRGRRDGTISAGVAANRWGTWSSMSLDPKGRLHVLVHE